MFSPLLLCTAQCSTVHHSPLRPHSTDSQTHKKMTLSMADRSSKTNQIKVISQVGVDPEANR